MQQLQQADRRRLLAVARRAIEAELCVELPFDPSDAPHSALLRQPAAAFVTIRKGGALRGCVGELRFETPLWANVRDAAVAAAFGDPRFAPLIETELPHVDIEVSVLAPPVPLPDAAGFEPGRHGIIVERGWRRGLLLPQVATEMGWDAGEMLDAVCVKAALAPSAWREPGTCLSIFEASHFSEAEEMASSLLSAVEAGRRG